MEPWKYDLLDRQRDAEHLVSVLTRRYLQRKEEGRTASYILNIDAKWGDGKSFFLDALRTQLSDHGHLTALINAWRDDLSDEPLSTMIEAIDESVSPVAANFKTVSEKIGDAKRKLGIIAIEGGKQVAKHAAKLGLGISVDAIAEKLGASEGRGDDLADDLAKLEGDAAGLIEKRIQRLRVSREAIAGFKKDVSLALRAAWDEDGNIVEPMFVFVDELDRCRPNYAIELLEQIKHLFDIDGIVFVVATDSEQLSHSIKAVYGSDFDGRRYLRRFFDRTFVFPTPARDRIIENFATNAGISLRQFYSFANQQPLYQITKFFDIVNASNRDVEQMMDMIEAFVTSWPHDIEIVLIILLPLLWAAYRAEWHDFNMMAVGHPPSTFSLNDWTFSYQSFSPQQGSVSTASMNGSKAYTEFWQLARSPLPDISQNERTGPVAEFFANEFQVLHGNRYQTGNPPRSVIHEYAERARNTGRIIER